MTRYSLSPSTTAAPNCTSLLFVMCAIDWLEFDQAINDIRRKYEVEKQESVNHEKEKVLILTFILSFSVTLIKYYFPCQFFRPRKLSGIWKNNWRKR